MGKLPSPPSHMTTSKFFGRQQWRDEISENKLGRPGSYGEALSLVFRSLIGLKNKVK